MTETGFYDAGAAPAESGHVTWREKVRSLVPDIGSAALQKKLVRPQTYRQAVAAACDVPRWRKINSHLADYTKRNGQFFFVQIGANDGVGTDPIHTNIERHGWNGVLVEPVTHTFAALQRNYAGRAGLRFANVAVAESEGKATMFAGVEMPDGSKNPLGPMSSFCPDVIQKHAWIVDDVDHLVRPTEVQTTTLAKLFQDYDVTELDGLFVDTEGYDKVVLDQLDYDQYRPNFILYEHIHLTHDDQVELTGTLRDQGYELTTLRRDTFAELA